MINCIKRFFQIDTYSLYTLLVSVELIIWSTVSINASEAKTDICMKYQEDLCWSLARQFFQIFFRVVPLQKMGSSLSSAVPVTGVGCNYSATFLILSLHSLFYKPAHFTMPSVHSSGRCGNLSCLELWKKCERLRVLLMFSSYIFTLLLLSASSFDFVSIHDTFPIPLHLYMAIVCIVHASKKVFRRKRKIYIKK